MVPNYLLMRDLKWLDTFHALIWPAAPNVFGLFLLRQFFSTFPRELEEAAYVDGASRLRIYWQLMIPVNRNALIALGIFRISALVERSLLATDSLEPGREPDLAGGAGCAGGGIRQWRYVY